MPFSANLSVVTYTFNDAALASGLLESIASWTVKPREIIVVDDGSPEPFLPPDTAPTTRLLRLEPNRGATRAKQAGLDAAQSKFLLSVDADIRLPPDWAGRTMALAAEPDVGLVATPMIYDSGSDALSRYMALAYGFRAVPGPTDYIPGPAWLIRRETWQSLGGFSDYRERIGEDSHLCAKLREAGLSLVIAEGAPARQVRKLTRSAMVKRGFTWQGSHLREQLDRGAALDEVMGVFLFRQSKRLPARLAAEPVFAYFELLYTAHGLLELAGRDETSLAGDFLAGLAAYLGQTPGLAELLAADLKSLGHGPLDPSNRAAGSDQSAKLIAAVTSLFHPELLGRLEERELAEIAAAGEAAADFSFYLS